jgi:hypothetical protein
MSYIKNNKIMILSAFALLITGSIANSIYKPLDLEYKHDVMIKNYQINDHRSKEQYSLENMMALIEQHLLTDPDNSDLLKAKSVLEKQIKVANKINMDKTTGKNK